MVHTLAELTEERAILSEDVTQNCPSSKEADTDKPNKKMMVTSDFWSRPVRHGIGNKFAVFYLRLARVAGECFRHLAAAKLAAHLQQTLARHTSKSGLPWTE